MALTDTKIKTAKATEKTYKLYDSMGLYLEVPPTGSKRWRFKYRFSGREKLLSLGLYPAVSLKRAREKRDEARQLLEEGIDPSRKRRAAATSGVTFRDAAEEWMEKRRNSLSERHHETIVQRLSGNAYPYIGRMPIGDIAPTDILEMVRVVEKRGALEAARRTLGICSMVFRFAVASGYAASDPCRDLKGALESPKPKRHAAITDKAGAGQLMRDIDSYHGAPLIRLALRFMALTFVRSGELRGCTWQEIDWEERVWLIPKGRMKGRREHLVPLSKQAIAVLEDARLFSGERMFVFQSMRPYKDVPLSDASLLRAIRNLGYDKYTMIPHGFRAMASSLLNEQGWRPDVIERQLAHVEKNKVRAAYHRTEYLTERREMMQAWADYLDQLRASPRK